MAKHLWSGWPNSTCIKCHTEDPLEIAMADGWYDCYPDDDGNAVERWDSEEHRQEVILAANDCPHPCENYIDWYGWYAPQTRKIEE